MPALPSPPRYGFACLEPIDAATVPVGLRVFKLMKSIVVGGVVLGLVGKTGGMAIRGLLGDGNEGGSCGRGEGGGRCWRAGEVVRAGMMCKGGGRNGDRSVGARAWVVGSCGRGGGEGCL